jgi:general secretion pathway protein E
MKAAGEHLGVGGTSVTTAEATLPSSSVEVKPNSLRAEFVSPEFVELIARDFARAHLIVSQGRRNGAEQLAIAEQTNPAALFNVGVRLGCTIDTVAAEGESIARLIDEVYGQRAPASDTPSVCSTSDDDQAIQQLLAQADRDLLSTEGKGPIVQLVDALFFEALSRRASDVHIQPLADRTLVRYRLDGVLHTARELPPQFTASLISRIKVMGRMDIAEKRIPQDGRASVTIGDCASRESAQRNNRYPSGELKPQNTGRSIDLRISTLPTSYGERTVIRLLDNANHLCDFESLGMPQDVADRYVAHAHNSNGIILLTGPTGSGKTTTLYATLRLIGTADVNIMTIEDPIEYELSTVGLAISQAQVNPRKGVTFATGLRHILRQDPDVVMVGEIRDAETARIAVQSSLTGHLVFSTLHTNDAAGAITRLIDLGIEPYLVSASLSAAMAQRLVRLNHQSCHGKGCEACFDTGFLGRRGLFELLSVDEPMRELIGRNASHTELRTTAIKSGMRTLHETGRRLVESGSTSELEVQRIVQATL